MSEELQTTVRELPEATVIDLVGDVTSFADARLHTSFDTASARGLKYIILNFAAVEYINSAGIATVISILADARGRAQQLLIVGLNDHYRKIFRMVGVARYAELFETEQQALAKIAEPAS
ncbi:MAG TPA: STAS domain-containing protein [Chloroflexia bacterium]|nr:STAS domain-containing protein [Chloroflexia bacterium]